MPANYAFEYFVERIEQAEKFGAYEKDEKDSSTKTGEYMQHLRRMISYIKGESFLFPSLLLS